MRVWRVAHQSQTYKGFPSGPYISDGLTDDIYNATDGMSWAHTDNSHRPPSSDARLGLIYEDERCGFDSKEALYRWFEGYTELLSELGFMVWSYYVPADHVRVGDFGQAVFHKDFAGLVSCHDFEKEEVPA